MKRARKPKTPAAELARQLRYTARQIELELAEVSGFLDDLRRQAKRVAKLGGRV